MAQPNTPSIQREITRINVAGNRTFAHPFTAPIFYREAMSEILSKKQALPSGEDFSYLLHAAYCGPKEFQKQPESQDLREKMKSNYFWLAQRNLWVPEKYRSAHGVFVAYDEKGVGLSEELDVGELEKSLNGGITLENGIRFSEDGKTGFAPRNTYKSGEMTPEEFAKDGFVIITNKSEGAKRLEEVSSSKHFEYSPRTLIVEPTDEPIQTLSAVYSYWYDNRLYLSADFSDSSSFGFASGVFVPGEASAKKF